MLAPLYGATEAFRFYDGPIDNPDDGPEGQINAWPLDEAYIDYVEDDPEAGIINDTAGVPEITTDVLVVVQRGGRREQHLHRLARHRVPALGPGPQRRRPRRPPRHRLHHLAGGRAPRHLPHAAGPAARRRPHRRARPVGPERRRVPRRSSSAIRNRPSRNIFRSMGALSQGELAGERIAVAYDTKDQEDEHSCFSDNTTADIAANAAGVGMIYTADYPGVDGPSLADVVAEVDEDGNQELLDLLDTNVARAEALPAPFDQLILGDDDAPGRQALLAIITEPAGPGRPRRRDRRRPRLLDQPGDLTRLGRRPARGGARHAPLRRRAAATTDGAATGARLAVRRGAGRAGRRRHRRGGRHRRLRPARAGARQRGPAGLRGRQQLLQRQLGHRPRLDRGP